MYKVLLALLLGAVAGAELAHIQFHNNMEADPHSHCKDRFPELR